MKFVLVVGDFFEDQGFYVLRWKKKGGENQIEAVPPDLQHALQNYLKTSEHGNNSKAPLFVRVKEKGVETPLSVGAFVLAWNTYRRKTGWTFAPIYATFSTGNICDKSR